MKTENKLQKVASEMRGARFGTPSDGYQQYPIVEEWADRIEAAQIDAETVYAILEAFHKSHAPEILLPGSARRPRRNWRSDVPKHPKLAARLCYAFYSEFVKHPKEK